MISSAGQMSALKAIADLNRSSRDVRFFNPEADIRIGQAVTAGANGPCATNFGRDWCAILEHDPEKWEPVFPRDKREAFARRSCSDKKTEHDDDSKKSITP